MVYKMDWMMIKVLSKYDLCNLEYLFIDYHVDNLFQVL